MAIDILMPALSPTMTEGMLSKWLVKLGDEVRSGDVIAEIETDKATMEVEAIEDGVVAQIIVSEGTEGIAVNSVIAILSEEGESPQDLSNKNANDEEKTSSDSKTNTDNDHKNYTETHKTNQNKSAGVNFLADSSVTEKIVNDNGYKNAMGERIFATPLARRMAKQNNIDLTKVGGTGPNGRIIERDILAFSRTTDSSKTAKSTSLTTSSDEGRLVPHSSMRRTIAGRLQLSKQTAPHFYLTIECSIDRLLENRMQLNKMVPSGIKISVNDMIIKASAMALEKVPEVNGWFEEDGCRYFDTVDICMAVAIKGGLITPVIRSVENLGLSKLSLITKDLATRARENKLKPEEYNGGGFTISNLGMFGVKEFAAVINPPQSAILAVGAGEQRAVVHEGDLAIATIMNVTLSADHRIVDGALGAEWLQVFKGFIENPVTMLI